MATTACTVPLLRRFARLVAVRWAVPEHCVDVMSLVVSELVTNAVLHSGSPHVTLLVSYGDTGLTVEVTDSGRWLARSAPRCAAEDDDAVCGRGLDLVRGMADCLLTVSSPAGTRVVACVPVGAVA